MMEFTAALEFRISSQHRLPTYEEWHVLSVWKPYRIFVMLEPIQEYFTEFILSFECLTPMLISNHQNNQNLFPQRMAHTSLCK